jgi:signal transduction histidine kinase
VPSGDIPRLLQPFQRRVAGRAGAHGGLGLGLPIAHAVAEAHGAKLSVTPRDGGGLTTELVFPLSREPATPLDQPVTGGGRLLRGEFV